MRAHSKSRGRKAERLRGKREGEEVNDACRARISASVRRAEPHRLIIVSSSPLVSEDDSRLRSKALRILPVRACLCVLVTRTYLTCLPVCIWRQNDDVHKTLRVSTGSCVRLSYTTSCFKPYPRIGPVTAIIAGILRHDSNPAPIVWLVNLASRPTPYSPTEHSSRFHCCIHVD